MTHATAQPRLRTFSGDRLKIAAVENKFFLRVVDAKVTFVKDEKGQVTGLVIHQGGRDVPGKKIK